MDARPLLAEVGRRLNDATLDAVLIGNAAAALQGAPVTTVDFDLMCRRTPRNLGKLKLVAGALRATILRPYYPASDLYRVVRDDDGLQVDFMVTIHGVPSFEGLKTRATRMEIGGTPVLVAAVRRERERVDLELIRRRLALPPERRTNFLRKRVGVGRSAL